MKTNKLSRSRHPLALVTCRGWRQLGSIAYWCSLTWQDAQWGAVAPAPVRKS